MRKTRPHRSRRTYRFPFRMVSFLFVVAYCATLLFWPLDSVTASVSPSDIAKNDAPAPELSWPAYGQSALGTQSGAVFEVHGEQTAVPIASITKIVTALVVLDQKPITEGQQGPTITLTAADAQLYDAYFVRQGSIVKATAGMQLTEYQLLQGMLIASANNYADTLAVWAYGSMEAYLSAAQNYLQKHQLTHTTIADASGFSPDSKSTASNLVLLGSLALKHAIVADIVSQKSAVLPGAGEIHSTNILLATDQVIGIKTGTTDEAGSCLLYAAQHIVDGEPITIIGATLGGPNHLALARDVKTLLGEAKQGFQTTALARKHQVFATYKTPWSTVHAVAEKSYKAVVWPGQQIQEHINVQTLKPGSQPQTVGTVTFKHAGSDSAIPLKLDKALETPSWLWRLTHPADIIRL